MNDESTSEITAEPTDQERLMALLALTAQDLPYQPRVASALASTDASEAQFRRLDADPALLEAYLRRGMRALPGKSATLNWRDAVQVIAEWLSPPRLQFAAAAAAVALGLLVFWQLRSDNLLTAVEQSYTADIALPADGMTLPWERRAQTQGFSTQSGNETAEGRAFAIGLLQGRDRMQGGALSSPQVDRIDDRFIALGEWNVLLWSACQGSFNSDSKFWSNQLALAHAVGAAFAANGAPEVTTHLAVTEALVADMAQQPDGRKARRLAEELTRFREAFAPLNPAPTSSVPPPP